VISDRLQLARSTMLLLNFVTKDAVNGTLQKIGFTLVNNMYPNGCLSISDAPMACDKLS